MEYRILVIDPGSTSTKVYVCEGKKEILKETIMYSSSYINKYDRVYDQFQFRKEDVLKILRKRSFDLNTLSAVVGRGGLLNLREDKIYRINEAICYNSR